MNDNRLPTLARSAAEGDSKAFRLLVEATHDRIYRVALRSSASPADAEDVVQEAYVKAWRSIGKLRDPEAVVGWLASITRHCAKDRARAQARRPTAMVDGEAARLAVEGLVSESPDAESRATSTELRKVVMAALDGIDDKFTLPLLLKEVDGFTGEEVAELLGIPVGTVESRATRGRAKLAKKLRRLAKGGGS